MWRIRAPRGSQILHEGRILHANPDRNRTKGAKRTCGAAPEPTEPAQRSLAAHQPLEPDRHSVWGGWSAGSHPHAVRSPG